MFSFGKKRLRVRISKKTRLVSHILASAAFIALFIWGWDLQVSDAVAYLIISLAFLFAILLTSALLGWLMRIMRSRADLRFEGSQDNLDGSEPRPNNNNKEE